MKDYNKRPEFDEWDDPNFTVYKEFSLAPHRLQVLMRLVDENLYDKGNEGYLKSDLMGTLRSMYYFQLQKALFVRNYPRTGKIRYFLWRFARKMDRKFKTKRFRSEVTMINLLRD